MHAINNLPYNELPTDSLSDRFYGYMAYDRNNSIEGSYISY